MQQELKIPKERIAVLIGEEGSIKRQVEKATKSKITINSKEGDVFIEGEDSLKVIICANIVKAVGRGFNPKVALDLTNEDYTLEIINIQDFTGKSKAKEERIKARIIGTRGKARRTLEQMTNTSLSIYGKTVAIIGSAEDTVLAKKAVEQILNGAPHSHAYRYIDDFKKRHSGEI